MDGMPQPLKIELTIEQEFNLRLIEDNVARMSEAQAKDMLLQAARLLAMKDSVIRSLIRGDVDPGSIAATTSGGADG